MTAIAPFPHAGFLHALEQPGALAADVAWTPALARTLDGSRSALVADALAMLLKARRATCQAAFDTTLAADELRRYQKFAKPGKPSPHIVQLRQRQAAARQASSIARQALIKAATVFVREAAMDVPERMTLEDFIIGWIDANVPRDAA